MLSENSRVDEPEPSLQSEKAELARQLEQCQQRKYLPRNGTRPRHIYLEILLPCLDNHSEEAMFGSNQIQEQHETMKLQKKEATLKNT